ncbi:cytochrome b5-related protein-like [Chironomus tepperi]|uniref:cytochrome b5-related protein-like n=1 Tax=Chironomus tepperi TaxID=113505 RepID=UPI00391F1FB6
MERVQTVFGSIARKYPTNRDESIIKLSQSWLETKRIDDEAEGLWRVHDKLYDLTDFIERHPGGAEWISLTKGVDITEEFETHHLYGKAEPLLKKFYIRDAKSPRNYKFTYADNGFYRTLKRRVADMLPDLDNKPKKISNMISDLMLSLVFATSVLAAKDNNFYLALLAGTFLNFQLVIAHNYFHRKDNWRMFCFNLTLLNYTEWRISHALSHHLYTNSYYDMEITMFEPHLQWLPRPKTLTQKISSWILSPVVWSLIGIMATVYRIIGYFKNIVKFRWDHLLALTLPIAMFYFGQRDIWIVLKLWFVITSMCSFLVGVFGLNAGHHHPDVTHEGDELPKGMDFGVFQMNAVIDRNDIKNSHFIALVTFGHHTLHHLFPTLDHGLLPQLHEVFISTCKDFEIELREYPWWPLIVGQFQQLARTKPKSLKESKQKDL